MYALKNSDKFNINVIKFYQTKTKTLKLSIKRYILKNIE